MNRLIKNTKFALLAFIAVMCSFIAVGVTTAATFNLDITGLNSDNNATYTVGEDHTWTAVAYADGQQMTLDSNSKITWTSSNPSVVSVSNVITQGNATSAKIKAEGAGRAVVTAIFSGFDSDGNPATFTATRNINVTLEITNAPDYVFEDTDVNYQVFTNSKEELIWETANEKVATVTAGSDGTGIISFMGGGLTTITAKTKDGSQRQSFEVVVNAKFTERNSDVAIPYNQEYKLNTNAGGDCYFETANADIVDVTAKGVARGVSAGVTTLTVAAVPKTNPWYSKVEKRTLNVHVDFDILENTKNIGVGDKLNLNTTISDEYRDSVTWGSSDQSVAEIKIENGVVYLVGKKKGTVTVRASIFGKDDIFGTTTTQIAEITVNVIDTFSLSITEKTINAEEEFSLEAIVTEQYEDILWESSDESVAKIEIDKKDNKKAVVKTLKKGEVIITASQVIDGIVTKTAECKVTVTQPVIDISIFEKDLELTIGQRTRLNAVFEPSRPDNMEVIWYSNDERIITVDQDGVVTAVGSGKTYVNLITKDGIKVASCQITVSDYVTGITLSETSVIESLSRGGYNLFAKVSPLSDDGITTADGVNGRVIWESTDDSIASVDEYGNVTFEAAGHVTIIATTVGLSKNMMNLTAKCNFIITQPVEGISLDYDEETLKVGEMLTVTAEIEPEDAYNKTIDWETINEDIVTVDGSANIGKVKAVSPGLGYIRAITEDGNFDAWCILHVYQPVTNMRFQKGDYTVTEGEDLKLAKELTITPKNATDYTIKWSSDNPSVAKVDGDGVVTGLKQGTTIITVTCSNDISDNEEDVIIRQCSVKVLPKIKAFTINKSSATIYTGRSFTLKTSVTPKGIKGLKIIFSSSNPDVATVDEFGVVKGVSRGRTRITAVIEGYEEDFKQVCIVTVKQRVTTVRLTASNHYINKGRTKQMKYSVGPSNANSKRLQWWTTNTKVLKVNQRGLVKAVGKPGQSAYVYCMSSDGSNIRKKYKLKVINPVKKISIKPGRISIFEGKTKQLKAVVSPSNATIRGVKWTSTNPEVATVDIDGEITAVSEGQCKIYATSRDGNRVQGYAKVYVKKGVPATAVKINSSKITMLSGQTRKLAAKIIPTNATEKLSWYSTDTSVATVTKDGKVVAKGQGQVEIYAVSSISNVETSCIVTVLALNSSKIVLEQYDTFDLDVFGSTEKISWYTSNNRVATVSSSGKVTAKMAGFATITAKVNGKTLYCKVQVTTMKRQ